MHLSPEDIAAAEACGVSFLAASDAQVQRLAMQRKVFYRAGAPILATRGDGFFETVGTLQQLIEEGRQQQRDLSQWLEAAAPSPESAPEAASEPEAARAAPVPVAEVGTPVPEPAILVAPTVATNVLPRLQAEPAAAPKRPRQKRRRPEPATEEEIPVTAEAEAEAEIEVLQASDTDEVVANPLPPSPSRSLGRTAVRAPAVAVEAPGQDRGKRWLMAGAARRGRAGKHWSTRQR